MLRKDEVSWNGAHTDQVNALPPGSGGPAAKEPPHQRNGAAPWVRGSDLVNTPWGRHGTENHDGKQDAFGAETQTPLEGREGEKGVLRRRQVKPQKRREARRPLARLKAAVALGCAPRWEREAARELPQRRNPSGR